jgi:hypothetical protein
MGKDAMGLGTGTINSGPLISGSREATNVGSVPTVEHGRPLGDALE